MPIDSETRRDLRRLAHHLKPVVTVAERGLSDSVLQEIERALSDHELIKVKLAIADRELRAAVIGEMRERTGADHVADIGKISVLFKANPRAKPQLSNLQRLGAGPSTPKPAAAKPAAQRPRPKGSARTKSTPRRKPVRQK